MSSQFAWGAVSPSPLLVVVCKYAREFLPYLAGSVIVIVTGRCTVGVFLSPIVRGLIDEDGCPVSCT